MLLVLCVLIGELYANYVKHLEALDYAVDHEVLFKEEVCWKQEKGDVIVPSNCTTSYCSRCYYNPDIRDYRNFLLSDTEDKLIVGAMNYIISFDVTDKDFKLLQSVSTSPKDIDSAAYTNCISKRNSNGLTECQNYNRVLVKMSDEELLSCGTNAYEASSACQLRKLKDLSKYDRVSSEGFTPINVDAKNIALVEGKRLFVGTLTCDSPDKNCFALTSAKLQRSEATVREFTNVVTSKYSKNWLSRPKFMAAFALDSYLYFFFQEKEYQLVDPKEQVVSRVGRVCIEDSGFESVNKLTPRLWRTFVKATMECTNEVDDKTFGKETFFYTRINDVTLDGDTLYAAFSKDDSISGGSVICRYSMNDINDNFDNGLYWNLVDSATRKKRALAPTCENMADENMNNDIKNHKLAVTPITSKDILFLKSGSRFTKILLDTDIRDNVTKPVLFIGTSKGEVMKVTWKSEDTDDELRPILVEQIQVAVGDLNSDLSVNFMAFEKRSSPNYVFVGTGVSISKVVIARCQRIPKLSKSCCAATQDPYCGWCGGLEKCNTKADCNLDWTRSLSQKKDTVCKGPIEPHDQNTTTREPVVVPNSTTSPEPVKNGTDGRTGDRNTESKSWKNVAIVMAVLCAIFVLISLLLAVNLLRKRWCKGAAGGGSRKPGHVKSSLNNYPHNYNPLSSSNGKEGYTERIPVYKTSPAV